MLVGIKKYAKAVGAAYSILEVVRVFGKTPIGCVYYKTLIDNLIIAYPLQEIKSNFWKDDVYDGF